MASLEKDARERDQIRAAVVTTLRVPRDERGVSVVMSWCRWHLGIGFSHLFLFFDEPLENVSTSSEMEFRSSTYPPTEMNFPNHPAITALHTEFGKDSEFVTILSGQDLGLVKWQKDHCPSWERYSSFLREEVQARQVMNAETALVLAKQEKCTWLVHLDIDELFYTGPEVRSEDENNNVKHDEFCSKYQFKHVPLVTEHFRMLEDKDVYHMTYINHEAVPETHEVSDYFKEVSLFRRHHFSIPMTAQAREAMKFWEQRTNHGQYLLVYDCGKSATRVVPGVSTQSVHHWKLPQKFNNRKKTGLADPRNLNVEQLLISDWPCILHYVTCGVEWFQDKYEVLGNFESSWYGGELPIAPSFHLDARDVTQSRTEKAAKIKAFFEKQVLFDSVSGENELRRQLTNNVCMRIDTVMKLLSSTQETPEVRLRTNRIAKSNTLAKVQGTVSTSATTITTTTTTTTSFESPLGAISAEQAQAAVAAASTTSTSTPTNTGAEGAASETPTPKEETLNFQKAWILSSVAQNYL